MDDGWVCASCHSINAPGSARCYKCRRPPSAADDLAGVPPTTPKASLLQAGMTTVCPRCGAARVGWERYCRGCRLDYDELAKLELIVAASRGPGSLGREFLRRLPVLIPGLVVGAVLLLVLAIMQLAETP